MRTETVGAVGEQDVRRLDVAVDDPARVRMGEPVEDLRGRLDGGGVVELAALERVPERAAGNVLVGDVDVSLVARERVGAQAGGMLELGRRGRLPLGARSGGACAGDDLERDLAVLALVSKACQTEPIPPLPSGLSGRYRSRTSAGAAA